MNELYKDSKQYQRYTKPMFREIIRNDLRTTLEKIRDLTPAGRRMLYKIHSLLESNKLQPIDRTQIAAALGRPGGLTLWDRRLLKRLESEELIKIARQPLPTYVNEHNEIIGRGAKFTYSMTLNVAWRVHEIFQKAKEKGYQFPD